MKHQIPATLIFYKFTMVNILSLSFNLDVLKPISTMESLTSPQMQVIISLIVALVFTNHLMARNYNSNVYDFNTPNLYFSTHIMQTKIKWGRKDRK